MRKVLILTAILLLQFSCSTEKSDDQNIVNNNYYNDYSSNATGNLFIIGGGEISDNMWQNFIDMAGDGEKNVLIIPQANSVPGAPESTGMLQQKKLLELGVASCDVLLCDKEDLDKPENLDKLKKANLIFISGGHQARLTKYLNGSEFLNRIKSFYNEGGTIGGTSAGAAVMSKIMIGGGRNPIEPGREKLVSIEKGHVITLDGFGFMENVVIHQHFLYRKRHNTLFSVLLDNPGNRGIGIDESTAIIVRPDNTFEVIGESKVMVYEPDNDFSDDENPPAFIIRILSSGDTYKL